MHEISTAATDIGAVEKSSAQRQSSSSSSIRAAVIGATGFTGVELVSILTAHPVFTLAVATARCDAGQHLSDLYPALAGSGADILLTPLEEFDPASADVVFLAVPHTSAMGLAPKLLEAGIKVIDLSADFRIKDASVYQQWYGVEHTAPPLLDQAVYALPELTSHEAIENTQLLSCPGCYPTATALAAAPLVASSLARVGTPLIVDAKSGVSGAGRKASEVTHFCTVAESVHAYRVGTHQHTPEIEQILSGSASRAINVSFTPHLVPMKRGLLSTVHIACQEDAAAETVHALYLDAYRGEPFVSILPLGQQPKTSEVTGTNHARIGIGFDARTHIATVTCAIDNLGKGASSQAVQVANISYGLDQATGLGHFRSIV